MGRKPKAEKLTGKAPRAGNLSPSLAVEAGNAKPEVPKHSDAVRPFQSHEIKPGKSPKSRSTIVRRSGRLRNVFRPLQSQEIETVIDEINLIESEREDDPYVEEHTHTPIPEEKSLEEKVDYIVQIVEELRSKGFNGESESTPTDIVYKDLYLDAHKRIEALNVEVYQLNKKLESALGRLKAYENVKDLMDKLKEVILMSNLTKASEVVVNLSSQLAHGQLSYSRDAAEHDTPGGANTASATKKKRRVIY